jgi:hypothetical protein
MSSYGLRRRSSWYVIGCMGRGIGVAVRYDTAGTV